MFRTKRDYDAAERLNREALTIGRKALGDEHPGIAKILHFLALVLLAKKDYPAAETVSRELLGRERSDRWLAMLGMCLLKQGKHAEAESVMRECLAFRAKQMPGHWLTFNAMSMLGGSLAGQGKYAQAEKYLIAGYERMKPPAANANRKREALERLVKLYEACGKTEKATAWRAKSTAK